MQIKQLFFVLLALAVIFGWCFLSSPAIAGTKCGVVMDNHSGPEFYPAAPVAAGKSQSQCVACDEGQPYTDGFDHSADGYFAMKYFLGMLGNTQGAIPGFVLDSFGTLPDGTPFAHHQGIILMDKDNPLEIVDDEAFFGGTPYTPTLIDAWGEEGIFVDPSFPGADATGYISYTDLYAIKDPGDGSGVYIWAQPQPYPVGNPSYPAGKGAFNIGGVPFYLLPRDVMNEYEDAVFDGGGSSGYSWDNPDPAAVPYLGGPLEDPVASGYFYPDNGWNDMLGWEYDVTTGTEWFNGGVTAIAGGISAWEEHDFWEFSGFETYSDWQTKGGREVYMEEVVGMMNQVKDWIWANYDLSGEGSGSIDDYIYVTFMIDPCFCDGVDPKYNIHGKSLFDAVYNLIVNQQVDKIIIHDHFIGHSFLMNDDMGWRMINMAIMKANMDSGRTFSIDDDLIFAPGHPYPPGLLEDSPFKDYYGQFYIGSKQVPERISCNGFTGPVWSDELNPPDDYLTTREQWVGGIALRPEYRAEIIAKIKSELAFAEANGAHDIALFLSNHGTLTKDSWCVDSANDHAHFNHKIFFVLGVEALLADPEFLSAYGEITSKNYEPDDLSDAEIAELQDGMDGIEIAILDQDIKLCTVELATGRKIIIYRVSGQYGFTGDDPLDLTFSPREAITDIMDVQNPTPGTAITHVIDLLYQFTGQSGDLLLDHRIDGYGDLAQLALVYSNPIIDDTANANSWKNFLDSSEQYCYPPEDNSQAYGPCWDFGHNNPDPDCNNPMPEGCYVSLFTIYDDAGDPQYDPINTPNGLKVKITNGSWGFSGKVNASKAILKEVLDQFCDKSRVRASFETIPRNRKVLLKWTALGETSTMGFNIHRSTEEFGELVKINDTMIVADSDKVNYTFIDRGLKNGVTYYYQLESIDMNGQSAMYGPVGATPRLFFWIGNQINSQ